MISSPNRASIYSNDWLGDPKHIDWLRDVAANQGSRSIAWRIIKIEGPGMVDEERPRSKILHLIQSTVNNPAINAVNDELGPYSKEFPYTPTSLLYGSVINGPFKYGTVTEPETPTTPATFRDRHYKELTDAEKIHEACDIKATNTVPQGLPQDIYKLVNHHSEAKDIWDRVKLLNEGLEISLQERESKLYDEFNTFTSVHGETIHSYYLRQNGAISTRKWLLLTHHLLLDIHQPTISLEPRLTQGIRKLSKMEELQCRQFRGDRLRGMLAVVQEVMLQAQGLTEIGELIQQVRQRPKNSTWFKEKMLLVEALESRVALDEGQMAFLADNGDTVNTSQESQEIPNLAIFQTDELDAFDSDCDDAPLASNVLMAKLYAYDLNVYSEYYEQPSFINDLDTDITSDSNIISYKQYLKKTENAIIRDITSSVQQDALIMSVIEKMSNQVAKRNKVDKVNKTINESLTAELEIYKDQINFFKERRKFELNDREKYIDSQLREVTVDRNAKVVDFQNQLHSFKLQLSATVESHKTLSTTVDVLKQECKAKKDKYYEEIIDLEKKNKALDNMIYKMGQSTQTMHMLTKPQVFYDECHKTALGYQNPLYLTQAQRKVHALYCGRTIVKQHDALSIIDTEETLELAEESRLKMHAKQNDPIAKDKKVNIAPIDYAALNKLYEHFVKHFVPQKQLSAKQAFWLPISKPVSETLPVQLETVLKEIPRELPTISLVKDSFNKMRSHVKDFDKVITVRTKLIISQDLVHTAVNTLAAIVDYQKMEKSYLGEYNENLELQVELSKTNAMVEKEAPEFQAFFEINELKAQLEAKNNSISKLKDHIATLKCKSVSEGNKSKNISKVITPRMYKLNFEPLSPKLLKNREARVDYLKYTQENADTLCEIVEQARALRPLDSDLDTTLISSTSADGLKPPGNTKKNRISRPTSSNKKNKVEDHLRSFKSSLNKKNRVFEPVCNANVKHSVLNANSELICSTYNECMFYAIHDLHVLDFLNDVNVYYVEGLGHNLLSMGQFCDSDLEVAFSKYTCYVRDLEEAVATACYTQNRYLIRRRHNKTPYELLHDRKPDLTYFHVFGALCYPTNDGEYLGKLKPKADIGIFNGYAPAKKAYRIYNKRTRLIMETMHAKFDELTVMASEKFSSGHEL
ncbi:retrovirus-related pol polyprotein from transposon TNT 1-94 [Tanacetum coccineum]